MEHCGERSREQLSLTVSHWAHPELLSAFVPSSVLELHSASLVHSKQMDFTEILLSGIYTELQLAA